MYKSVYVVVSGLLFAMAVAPAYAQTAGHMDAGVTGDVGGGVRASQTLNVAISMPASATAAVTVRGGAESGTGDASSAVATTALQAAASSAIDGDIQVTHVSLASTSVSMTYPVRARLFGIFPMTLTAEAQVDAGGAVELYYPWYSFLFATDQAAIQTKLKTVGTAASAYNTGTFTANQPLALLSLMHAAFQSSLDSSTTASGTVQ